MAADRAGSRRQVLTWRGQPVPWVAKWTEEDIPDQHIGIARIGRGQHMVVFTPPSLRDRDRRGVLWYRDGTDCGGRPLFAELHTARARRCMENPRCQVCGTGLPERSIPWLFSAVEWAWLATHPTTVTPPTCERCWNIAERRCPHLRAGAVRVHVAQRALWGVRGDLYDLTGGCEQGVAVPFDDRKRLRMLVAKQLVVRIDGPFTLVEGLDRSQRNRGHQTDAGTVS